MFIECKPAINTQRFGINTDHIVEWRIDERPLKDKPETCVNVLEVVTIQGKTHIFDLRNPKNQLLARAITGDYELIAEASVDSYVRSITR